MKPKSNYVGLTSLEFGVYDAVANYNIGVKSVLLLYEKINMKPGYFTVAGSMPTNKKRKKRTMLSSSFNLSENFKMKCRGELNGYQRMKNQRKIAENIINLEV